jgi:hypothetical protein
MGTVTKFRGNKRTIKELRELIYDTLGKEVEHIIETGNLLIEINDSTDHGEWEEIFKDNKPFSVQTALKRMAIARHPVLSNPAHGRALPSSWRTLYELSQIPEKLLSKFIEKGKIHSELKRSEAERLKNYDEEKEVLRQLIKGGAYQVMEAALADCGGNPGDFSILEKGDVPQELMDLVDKAGDAWNSLRNQLHSLMKEE